MKILTVTYTIYDPRIEKFAKNCTGGGIVIKNIAEYIGRKCDSYLMLGQCILPEMVLDHIHIVKTDYDDTRVNSKGDNSGYLNYMWDCFLRAVKEIEPDVVHIHGKGDFVAGCMELCRQNNILFAYTEHLFIGHNPEFRGYENITEFEDSLYPKLSKNIVTVSSGIKEKMLRTYPELKPENITVILNGTDFDASQTGIVPSFYEKACGRKIFLCVGTLLERKNQMQIVNAFASDKALSDKYCCVLCGNDKMEGKIQEAIASNNLENTIFYVGALTSEEMKSCYAHADALLMPSLSEGLSIAALEAIRYGLPIIMYRDSECALDMSDENVVLFIEERGNEGFVKALRAFENRSFDSEYIKDYSKQFSMENMADNYIAFYKKLLGD